MSFLLFKRPDDGLEKGLLQHPKVGEAGPQSWFRVDGKAKGPLPPPCEDLRSVAKLPPTQRSPGPLF